LDLHDHDLLAGPLRTDTRGVNPATPPSSLTSRPASIRSPWSRSAASSRRSSSPGRRRSCCRRCARS